jgi:hypothetical protein
MNDNNEIITTGTVKKIENKINKLGKMSFKCLQAKWLWMDSTLLSTLICIRTKYPIFYLAIYIGRILKIISRIYKNDW